MEPATSLSATSTTSSSSLGAGTYNIPGDNSPKMDATEEDSKFKENEEEEILISDIEVLTIEDSTLEKVPPHLEALLKSYSINESQQADILIVLIYGIALECCFASQEEVQNKLRRLRPMKYMSTFHSRNVNVLSKMPNKIYDVNKMTYTILLQIIFDCSARPYILTGVVTGDLLILTLTPSYGVGRSTCLSIARYVLNTKAKSFPSRLRKLPELSHKLRDDIFTPIRNNMIKKEAKSHIYPGLDGLPEELYPFLYKHMNINNLKKIANVSRHFQRTVEYYKKHFLKRN